MEMKRKVIFFSIESTWDLISKDYCMYVTNTSYFKDSNCGLSGDTPHCLKSAQKRILVCSMYTAKIPEKMIQRQRSLNCFAHEKLQYDTLV